MRFDISERIKFLRNSKELSANKLSKELGISQSSISLLESGKNKPSFELLEKICDYFEISLSEFFSEDDNIKSQSDLSEEEIYILKLWNNAPEDTKSIIKSYLKKESISQDFSNDDISMLLAYKKASPAEKIAIDALLNQYKDVVLQKHA